MRSELKWVLILFVLMAVIWTATLLTTRSGGGSTMGLLLLIGSLWATFDFLRALWRYVRAVRAPGDEEDAVD